MFQIHKTTNLSCTLQFTCIEPIIIRILGYMFYFGSLWQMKIVSRISSISSIRAFLGLKDLCVQPKRELEGICIAHWYCIKIQSHQCLWKPCAGNATKKFDSCNLLFHRQAMVITQRKSKTQSRKPNTKCATVNVEDFIFVLIDSAVAGVISRALRRNKEFPMVVIISWHFDTEMWALICVIPQTQEWFHAT